MNLNNSINIRNDRCAVSTVPFHLISNLITICFVKTSNSLQYFYNVVFLFHCFLVITVFIYYLMMLWTDRVFRNETLDATHLAEFHQIEGVVADYGLTLGHCIGVINTFFTKLGIGNNINKIYQFFKRSFPIHNGNLEFFYFNPDPI